MNDAGFRRNFLAGNGGVQSDRPAKSFPDIFACSNRRFIFGAPPLLPSDVPEEYDFKRRRRPDIKPVEPESNDYSAPGSIEGHTGQATLGIFSLRFADDKAVKVTKGAYLAGLFVCGMNLKWAFDRESKRRRLGPSPSSIPLLSNRSIQCPRQAGENRRCTCRDNHARTLRGRADLG